MIKLEGIGKSFHGQWLFRGLSLNVQEGSSVVLIGPSGSGKSVLLKIVAGLLPADEGKVAVASSNVGMLFQKNALFDSLTVEENLLFPLKERKGLIGPKAREKAAHFLEAVGLKGN